MQIKKDKPHLCLVQPGQWQAKRAPQPPHQLGLTRPLRGSHLQQQQQQQKENKGLHGVHMQLRCNKNQRRTKEGR
jgi:hypothetical protein